MPDHEMTPPQAGSVILSPHPIGSDEPPICLLLEPSMQCAYSEQNAASFCGSLFPRNPTAPPTREDLLAVNSRWVRPGLIMPIGHYCLDGC